MVVRVPQLLEHVLANGKSYPGPHNVAQDRTSKDFKKLDPSRQLRLIFDAMCLRLSEELQKGNGVDVRGLGVFSFGTVLHESRLGGDKVAKVPAFIPSHELAKACVNYSQKSILNLDVDALSAAQSAPLRVALLSEVQVAAGCYLKRDVVASGMKHIAAAVVDLAERGYDLELELGADTKVIVKKGDVKGIFSKALNQQCAQPVSVNKIYSGVGPREKLSETWSKPSYSQAMATFLPAAKEDGQKVQAARVATANLSVMGRDLTTCQ